MTSIAVATRDLRLRAEMQAQLGASVVEPDVVGALLATSHEVLIVDVIQPQDVDFVIEVRRAARGGHVGIVALVEEGARELRKRAIECGADDHLVKPCSMSLLRSRLEALVDVWQWRAERARQRLRLETLEARRNDLTNLLVHDLRSPLAVVVSNLSYITDVVGDLDEIAESLADATSGASLLQRMILNLLDVARAEAGRFEVARVDLDLGRLLREAARLRRREASGRQIEIVLEVDDGLIIAADADVIRRVIDNLLENAIRFAGSNGRLLLRATSTGDTVELVVANSGPPVPLEKRQAVFEKFGDVGRRTGNVRVDLGLGLHFCDLAVKAHGGRIRIEEWPELPTAFVLDLPKHQGLELPAVRESSELLVD